MTESFWDPVARAWYLAQLFMGVDWRPPLMAFGMAALAPPMLVWAFRPPRRPKAVLLSLLGVGGFWLAAQLTDGLWAWWMYGMARPVAAALDAGMPVMSFKDLVLVYGLPGAIHGWLCALAVLAVAVAMRGRIRAHEQTRQARRPGKGRDSSGPAKQDSKKG